MATSADVENALRDAIAGAVGPTFGALTRVYRGWPQPTQLQDDLGSTPPIAHITVFPKIGAWRRIDPPLINWQTLSTGVPTLSLALSGTSVTIGGTTSTSQVVGIFVGTVAEQLVYAVRCGPYDTLATLANAFTLMIPGSFVNGNTLTINTTRPVSAIVVADSVAYAEVLWQEQVVNASIWAPNPDVRDAARALIAPVMALNYRATLADGSLVLWRQVGERFDDKPSQASAWFGEMGFAARYSTPAIQAQPTMLALVGSVTVNGAVVKTVGAISLPTVVYIDQSGNPLVDAAGDVFGPRV